MEDLRKIFLRDYHVHSEFSPCSEDTSIEKIAKISKEKDIEVTVTDHSYVFYIGKILKFSEKGIENKLDRTAARKRIMEYLEDRKKLRINIGIELDVLPNGEILFEKELYDKFYVKLGAIHYLDSLHNKRSYGEVIKEFKKQNMMYIDDGVDIIAHPFRILDSNDIHVEESLISWLVKYAYPSTALEVNAHKKFPETDIRMVKKCYQYDTKISIGTDSHRMSELCDFSYHKKIFLDSKINDIERLIFTKK